MTGLTARSLLNIVYALLAERADAADRAAAPVLWANGVKPKEIEDVSLRSALDRWLSAPSADEAAAEAALMRYLGAA